MINQKITFIVLSILSCVQSFGMPQEDRDNCINLPSNSEIAKITDGILHAVPRDLLDGKSKSRQLPPNAKGMQVDAISESSKISRSNNASLTGFNAVTDDYGQLKSILEANNGNEIDSLVVIGPMNKDDFKAIWDCAVYGNMQVLNLEKATMENNAIPDYAMYDPIQFDTSFWLKIRRIILPEGVVSIGLAAFPYMGVEQINIPSTVREIGATAFGYDRWLNCEIIIPEGVEEIKHQTFHECCRLTIAPKLPRSLKKIGEHAFSSTRFDNIVLPEGLEEIQTAAFYNCGLTRIHIPETCLTIGSSAFQGNWTIKEIILPENLESIPSGLFSWNYALEKITIHNKCKRIENHAFTCCTNLHEVNLNQGLEYIGHYAFDGCALTVIDLPPTLKQLGSRSFDMSTLHEVRCAAKIPPVCEEDSSNPGYGPFWLKDNDDVTLYVPYGTKDAYSSTWGWDCFHKIVETEDFPWAGTENVSSDAPVNDDVIYELSGCRVRQTKKGHIYICNGKRVIIQ